MTTGIEWTDETWNPVVGCAHVSAGCDHCYAAREASGRLRGVPVYAGLAEGGKFTGEVRLLPERLEQPLRWRKPRRVFVNSMSDLFHRDVPDEFVRRVWDVMAATPQHTYQILTKRPQRMAAMRRPAFPNVWLGTSVENQRYADLRIPHLLATPAAVRFLSIEPLLGPVDLHLPDPLREPIFEDSCVDWVIVGGESGPRARPMHVAWARSLRDQCTDAGIPFFFKQWGEWGWPAMPGDHALTIDGRLFEPGARLGMDHLMHPTFVRRVGKKAAGRELDGRTWEETP